MSNEERVTRVVSENKQPITVQLTRGANQRYRWQVTVQGASSLEILREIDEIDRHLSSKYGEAQPNPSAPTPRSPVSPDEPHSRMDHALSNIKKAGEKPVNLWRSEK